VSAPRDQDAPADRTGGLAPELAFARNPAPGASFGRYLDLQLLGSGGMATVFKAFDPTLGRTVALKLLRGDDPGLAERLLFEARSQARIEHPHVCRIYEAGVEEGRPYIAMQYVAGQTLKELHASLTLEQKLKVIREVAEAIHAAHRVGLVHRDLKPSNVMAERGEDGGWIPYVMDFGLAREANAPGLTATGLVLGTPWYMSPEQARGESRTLDRRSDVYSLGATLYELLGDHPPFDGTSSLEVMMQVLTEDPVPLGHRNAAIPRDVQTVVMKCLEKDPARRYDSARALADDLGRYLDGDPIEARPTGIHYRLYKRARKNRTAVAVVAAALLLVLVFAGLGLRARATARRQAELAAEFAREVEDIRWLMRVAHMAPLHDLGPEKARVRERLASITRQMRTAGSLAAGPGEYALGSGQLALGDFDGARPHLETAWKSGYRAPEVAFALGVSLGDQYRREMQLADSMGNRALREAKRAELQAKYREPAVGYLRQALRSNTAAAEYVEGLLAFYEKRYDAALAKAAAARAQVPWLYEASVLQGDVHSRLSQEKHETGDEAGSEAAVGAAESAYRAAADYARSEPDALEGLCQMGIQRMEAVLYARGDLAIPAAAARAACEQALAADPDRAEVQAKLSNIGRFFGESLAGRGKDPSSALDEAAEHARKAIALDPRCRRAHGNLGVIARLQAAYLQGHGLDASDALRQAFESLQKSVDLSGGEPGAVNDLANAYMTRAQAESDAGRDPRPDIERAVAGYERALSRMPDFGYAHGNRGEAFLTRARFEMQHGIDPSGSLEQARHSIERVVALLPGLEGGHVLLADCHVALAEFQVMTGADPSAALAAARPALADALRVNPKPGPDVSLLAGGLWVLEAEARLEKGLSPEQALAEAEARFQKAAADDPRLAEASRRLGAAYTLEARFRIQSNQDPAAALGRARSSLEDALRKDPKDAPSLASTAELLRRRAAWLQSRGRSADADITAGLASATRALSLHPGLPDALLAEGALLRLRAEGAREPLPRQQLAQQAADVLGAALAANALLHHEADPELERAKKLAAPQAFGSPLDGAGADR
jgi:predicted Ser/Thr protein kinase